MILSRSNSKYAGQQALVLQVAQFKSDACTLGAGKNRVGSFQYEVGS